MDQTIRNRDGTLIGTIRECNSDVIVAYNVDGTPIGTYYISRDTTYDYNHVMVGRGNALMALIYQCAGI